MVILCNKNHNFNTFFRKGMINLSGKKIGWADEEKGLAVRQPRVWLCWVPQYSDNMLIPGVSDGRNLTLLILQTTRPGPGYNGLQLSSFLPRVSLISFSLETEFCFPFLQPTVSPCLI